MKKIIIWMQKPENFNQPHSKTLKMLIDANQRHVLRCLVYFIVGFLIGLLCRI